MAQNNELKTYIRLDHSGRMINGTNINRKKMPVTGRWKEINAYLCCNPVLTVALTSTPADVTLTTVNFHLLCGATEVANLDVVATTTDLATLVTALNTNFSTYGVFTASGSDIELALYKNIADALCPDGVLSFVID